MANQILRVSKLSDKGSIGGSAEHALRERETFNAEPSQTPNNVILLGPSTAAGIIEEIGNVLGTVKKFAKTGKAGFQNIKTPIKPVLALEYLIGYSPDAKIDERKYFADALKWLQQKHGKENVVSAIVHYDETTPHMTVYVVPIHEKGGKPRSYNVADGRDENGNPRRKTITKMVGAERWLSAKAFVGSKEQLSQMQTDFNESVAANYGLGRGIKGSKATHTTVKSWYGKIPELPPRIASSTRQQLLEFGHAAWLAATRQKEMLEAERKKAEAAKKEAEQKIEQLRAQGLQDQEQHRRAIEAAERTARDLGAQIRSLGAQLRAQGQELRRWIADVLGRVWSALSAPDGATAARAALLDAGRQLLGPDDVRQLLPEPELRVEVRELAEGGWRATVIDADERERWSGVRDDRDDALEAAESWIACQAAAPGM